MNREETLKKFNTYSSLFLVLGILDLVLIWLSFGNKDMIALLHGGGSAAASALRILFLVTVVLGVILAVPPEPLDPAVPLEPLSAEPLSPEPLSPEPPGFS